MSIFNEHDVLYWKGHFFYLFYMAVLSPKPKGTQFYCLFTCIISEIFIALSLIKPRIPALLKISSDQNTVNRLKKDIKQLNLKLSQLQALLEEKEVQLRQIRR